MTASTELIQKQFTAALDDLVEQVKEDRSILAAILCGSLSYDTVWAKSDIDLVLVTIDDKKTERASLSLYADGLKIERPRVSNAEGGVPQVGRSHGPQLFHAFVACKRTAVIHAR